MDEEARTRIYRKGWQRCERELEAVDDGIRARSVSKRVAPRQ